MNRRIETIAGMVREGRILADIGTDHAQLPVMLVKAGRIPYAYACDVAPGPLKAAADNIEKNGLSGQIGVILSDGFRDVPQDAETAVIAGMGCHTALRILKEAGDRVERLDQVLVQVNTDVPGLRRWISGRGYTIEKEKVVRDRGHDYTVISFTGEKHDPYDELEILCGPYLLRHPDEGSVSLIRRNIGKLEFILEKRGNSDAGKIRELAMWREALRIAEKQETI